MKKNNFWSFLFRTLEMWPIWHFWHAESCMYELFWLLLTLARPYTNRICKFFKVKSVAKSVPLIISIFFNFLQFCCLHFLHWENREVRTETRTETLLSLAVPMSAFSWASVKPSQLFSKVFLFCFGIWTGLLLVWSR